MASTSDVHGAAASQAFVNDMKALDLKEEAQRLQERGAFEEALPLMLNSVAIRENSHTLCLSLSELGDIYLQMLHFDEAAATARRMVEEAHRYDAAQQTHIANKIFEDVTKGRAIGLMYGASVQLSGLARRQDLNGQIGVLRSTREDNSRYYVDVGSTRLLVQRRHLRPAALKESPALTPETM